VAEPTWRQRFRAARVSLPSWARDVPERCLYTSNAAGKWELYAWDRAAGSHRQVTNRPEGTRNGRLDPSGEQVWWFDDRQGNEKGVWMVETFEGGPARTAVPELEPAYGAGLALGRAVSALGLSDDDGARLYLVQDERARLVYQHRENARVAGLSRDDRLLCISHSEHGDSRHPALRAIELEGGATRELADGPGRGLWPLGFSPVAGDARLLVKHERAEMPRPLIWDAGSGAVDELAIDLPGEIDATWYPDGRALLLVDSHRGRSELYRYELATSGLERIETEPGTVQGAAVRPDGELWYGWTGSDRAPEVRAGGRTLLRPEDVPVPEGMERPPPAPGGVRYVDGHTSDGVHLLIAEPAGSRPHPTLLLVHGGPTSHYRDEFSPQAQAWVDHGIAVVMANYRGSTGYGRAWRDALEGNPGFTELADVAAAADWAVAEGLADPARLVLGGASWGGYITLLGLGAQPERWTLGVAGVPVADYVAAYEDEMEPLKAFDRALFGGTPEERPEFYRERSPITYVEAVRAPLLILAGENDPRCPIRQIDNYLARLRELGKPHELYRFNAGHGSLVVEESLRQMAVQLDFVTRHLGLPAILAPAGDG
jgi:acetyl esterase/lipase